MKASARPSIKHDPIICDPDQLKENLMNCIPDGMESRELDTT